MAFTDFRLSYLGDENIATRFNSEARLGRLPYTEVEDDDINVSPTNDYLIAFTVLTGARDANLPALTDVAIGKSYIVVDEADAAGTHDITIIPDGSDTINGAADLVIAKDRGFAEFYRGTTEWIILSKDII